MAASSSIPNPFAGAQTVVLGFSGVLAGQLPDASDICAAVHGVMEDCRRPDRPETPIELVRSVYDRLRPRDYCGAITPRQLWESVVQFVVDQQGFSYDQLFQPTVALGELVTRLIRAESECYRDAQLDPAAQRLVELAADRGLRTVLCADASACEWEVMRRLFSWLRFDQLFGMGNLVVSTMVERTILPANIDDQSLYQWLVAADGLDLNAGTTVLVAADSRHIRAAQALGCRTIQIGSGPITTADLNVAQLADLLPLLDVLPVS